MEKQKEQRHGSLERVLTSEGSDRERWEWRIPGTFTWHHPAEPALQYKNGNWSWYWMDKLHRLDGPATFLDGEYEYWIHNRELSREEWLVHPRRLEWLSNKLGGI